ncbi:unnamed protein product [Allacma fusca]|uniref:RRM domain-containing protein n=1 Tax=Allacma fusca TaxID=39272 RepID=A0A8J2PV00_9HEXA|nr:unnamed protein product [Allacma fusca]
MNLFPVLEMTATLGLHKYKSERDRKKRTPNFNKVWLVKLKTFQLQDSSAPSFHSFRSVKSRRKHWEQFRSIIYSVAGAEPHHIFNSISYSRCSYQEILLLFPQMLANTNRNTNSTVKRSVDSPSAAGDVAPPSKKRPTLEILPAPQRAFYVPPIILPAEDALSMLMPASTLSSATSASAASGLGLAPQQRDTTWTKLFVGGLPYHTTDKSLRDHFKVYGEIEEAVVITDRQTGKSRGYGFVIMSDRASAERACKEPNPIIDGRKANVNLAILGAKPRGNVSTTAAFPFTAIRTGYPTSILASQYGLPASYVYQPAAYGSAPLLSLPAATTSPALAAAIASAQNNSMSQFYDYQPANLAASGVTPGGNAAAAAAAFASPGAAHFAAQFAADPYQSYLAAAQGNPHAAQHAAAAHAAYAAYLPQVAAGAIPAGGGAGAGNAGLQINPYAAVAQDTRMQ